MTNLKAENNKLTTDVEIIMNKLDEIQEMKHAVENSMENLVVSFERIYKCNEMLICCMGYTAPESFVSKISSVDSSLTHRN